MFHSELQLPESSETILVGTPYWFEWLEQAKSFRFEMSGSKPRQTPSFTATKEKTSNADYWYAQRHYNGKLRKEYLGASADLTLAKLEQVAWLMDSLDINYWSAKETPAQL